MANETLLYFPKGEWETPLRKAFANAGMPLVSDSPRSLRLRFAKPKLPITWLRIRASDIPLALQDSDLQGRGGFTGSDIATENSYPPSWEFPLYSLEQDGDRFPRPRITISSTPNFFASLPDCAEPRDIYKPREVFGNIWTSYPNIARGWLSENGADFSKLKIKTTQGSIEGYWLTDRRNYFIVDIADTFKTQTENGCDPLAVIMEAYLGFLQQPNLRPIDQLIIDDLREAIYRAAQKTGGEQSGV
jgi:ATP phosphoribosyltransferase